MTRRSTAQSLAPARLSAARRALTVTFAASAVLAGAAVLAGCAAPGVDPGAAPLAAGSSAGTAATDTAALDGRTFVGTDVRGVDLPDGAAVTLTFADDRIAASAGLNQMSAPASWGDGRLVVDGPFRSTMMAGTPELEAAERWLVETLESEPELRLDGDTLVVGDETSGMTLVEDADPS